MKYNLLFGCFCVYLVSTCLAQTANDTSTQPTEKTSSADSTTSASTVEESKLTIIVEECHMASTVDLFKAKI